MKHIARLLALAGAVFVLTITFAMGQTSPGSSGVPPMPAESGSGRTPPAAPSLSTTKSIDGPVKDVDPAARTVSVGWLFGLLWTTLDVNDDTHIVVDGTKGSLDMIHEGDEVKASYEVSDGKNFAKTIDVTQPE